MPAKQPTLRLYAPLSALCAVFFYYIGDSYTARFAAHQGFHLASAEETLTRAPEQKPRRAVLVLIDGLRYDAALTMEPIQKLKEAGQCATTHTGSLTISRPVYTMLSSGVEQDRAGVRNNTTPIPGGAAVDSIWDVAKRAGLTVHGISELSWWRDLFPEAFDSYLVRPRPENYFETVTLGDLTLLHPVYVDEAAHDHGAASGEYQRSVVRAAQELEGLFSKLDLAKDLLIVTSDHGHSATGGHGGLTQEIVEVLTCFAGVGVKKGSPDDTISARLIGPSLSIFLGLPLPKQARIDEEEQAAFLSLFDENILGKEYLAERAKSLNQRREKQEAQLGVSWEALYQNARLSQSLWLGAGFGVALLSLLLLWRKREKREVLFGLLWGASLFLVTALVYSLLRYGFEMTSINSKGGFLAFLLPLSAAVSLLGALLHGMLRKDTGARLRDAAGLMLALAFSLLVHIVAFGWPLGFPLPSPRWFFYPFFASVFGLMISFFCLIFCALSFREQRRTAAQV